ncbi:MAG TPA: PadR family transcriptional regulator [Bryobacteraceae bacterium]|nr:PadR family transcriptional regulator [Bryobacteraceae bacterium]
MAQTTAQTTLDLLILKTLSRGPNHGFGITVHIQTASEGLLRIEEGSLYPALHRLERSRLIRGSWATSDNGRRARYYQLTGAGSKRLAEQENQWRSLSDGVGRVLEFAL